MFTMLRGILRSLSGSKKSDNTVKALFRKDNIRYSIVDMKIDEKKNLTFGSQSWPIGDVNPSMLETARGVSPFYHVINGELGVSGFPETVQDISPVDPELLNTVINNRVIGNMIVGATSAASGMPPTVWLIVSFVAGYFLAGYQAQGV